MRDEDNVTVERLRVKLGVGLEVGVGSGGHASAIDKGMTHPKPVAGMCRTSVTLAFARRSAWRMKKRATPKACVNYLVAIGKDKYIHCLPFSDDVNGRMQMPCLKSRTSTRSARWALMPRAWP